LARHLRAGNVAQLYAFQFSYDLGKALNIRTDFVDTVYIDSLEKQSQYSFTTKDSLKFEMRPYGNFTYFGDFPKEAEVLIQNEFGQVVGLSMKVGKGKRQLLTIPSVVSNYELLYGKPEAAEYLLSQMPNQNTYWSNDLSFNFQDSDKSLLTFIHSEPSLGKSPK
jgi:hypothetical protein